LPTFSRTLPNRITFILNLHEVIEYDKNFNEVWSFGANDLPAGTKFSPWAAIPLKNGNTLITNESGKPQPEVTPDKKSSGVSCLKIFPKSTVTSKPRPAHVLPIATTSYVRAVAPENPNSSKSPGKKVLWVLEGYANLGPATAVQVLDEPGIPENPGDSLH
jgi:hypothetical protein